ARFPEGRRMQRNPQAVALPGGSVRRSPIVVVGADCRHIPGALLHHLGDGSVVEIEAMLDGITSAIEGSEQADSAVSVARNLLTPAVSFIHDRPQLLNRQRGLRDQFAVPADP